MCSCSPFFFSLPLIFPLVAACISHFLTAAIKFSCFSSNEIGLSCFFISRSYDKVGIKIQSKERFGFVDVFFPLHVGACFFPPRKARAAHGPEARFPAKKGRFHLPLKLFSNSLPLLSHSSRVCTYGWTYADVITKFSWMDREPNCLNNGVPL